MADFITKETVSLNQFQNDYFNTLNDFRNKNMFCDVILEVDGTSYPCHRLVLTIASKYFHNLLNGDFQESTAGKVVIEGIKGDVMDQILEAIYSAQTQLSIANVYFMLKASHFLQLNGIFDVCVAYIVKNPCIHYLIDTCLFAKIFDQKNLYNTCVQAIADNFVILAKTNIFEEMPLETLNTVLSKGNFAKQRDEVSLSIIKWTKSNTCTAIEIQELLESAKLQNPSVLAVLLANSNAENMFANGVLLHTSDNSEGVKQSDSNISFNLYLSTVNVETGAVGWSSLTLDESFKFDEGRIQSDFHPLSSFSARICRVGSKIYCFESNIYTEQCDFSSYENGEKSQLTTPEDIFFECEFELVTIDNKILLIMNCLNTHIWAYDYTQEVWKKMFLQQHPSGLSRLRISPLAEISDWRAVTSSNTTLYVIGGMNTNDRNIRQIVVFDSRTPSTKKACDLYVHLITNMHPLVPLMIKSLYRFLTIMVPCAMHSILWIKMPM